MDPTEHARRVWLLRRQLAQVRSVADDLQRWAGRAPAVPDGEWTGSAAAIHAAACEDLRRHLGGCVRLADDLVAAAALALRVEEAT